MIQSFLLFIQLHMLIKEYKVRLINKFFILICAVFYSCGAEDPDDWIRKLGEKSDFPRQEPSVESIEQIVNSFIHDCGTMHGADISNLSKIEYIRYGDPIIDGKQNVAGVCTSWNSANGSVIKSNIVIKKLDSAISAKVLLYHELGHCVLELGHTQQDPGTIMSPSMLDERYYQENWTTLVKDLCTKYSK